MTPVDVHDVKTRIARRPGSSGPFLTHADDVGQLHRLRHEVGDEIARQLRRGDRDPPRLAAVPVDPGVVQLDPGERTVLVGPLRDPSQICGVVVVPHPRRGPGRFVGLLADRGVLRADSRPATLSLDSPVLGLREGLHVPEATAMGHLEEAVAEHLRPYCHRLEQDVVAWVASAPVDHLLTPSPAPRAVPPRQARRVVQGAPRSRRYFHTAGCRPVS